MERCDVATKVNVLTPDVSGKVTMGPYLDLETYWRLQIKCCRQCFFMAAN